MRQLAGDIDAGWDEACKDKRLYTIKRKGKERKGKERKGKERKGKERLLFSASI